MSDTVDFMHTGAARYAARGSRCQVLLVGEDNPYGADPEYALYPMPTGCSGNRLCRDIFALRQETYLGLWRTNLCDNTWSTNRALERADDLLFTPNRPWRTFVLLGRKVADAFKRVLEASSPKIKLAAWSITHFDERGRVDTQRRMDTDHTVISLPHPSGRNTVWAAESVRANARMILARELPAIPWGEALGDPL